MTLADFGFDAHWQQAFEALGHPEWLPARVAAVHRDSCQVWTAEGEGPAEVTGKFRFEAATAADFPIVGDWAAVVGSAAEGLFVIQALLPRRTYLARRAPGSVDVAQPLAANIDTALVVMGLDGDFNERRLDRYLQLIAPSGAQGVVVLSKCDLAADAEDKRALIAAQAPGVPVYTLSAQTGAGLEALAPYLTPGQTLTMLGSSGAGKSTLLNRLMGAEVARTNAVREDDSRGRHTTVHRELFRLPGGALMIDSPGIREVQLWTGETAENAVFTDIVELMEQCQFNDCSHVREPGCAILEALESGTLEPDRWASYQKLQRELEHVAAQTNPELARSRQAKWKKIGKQIRDLPPKERG